MQDEDPHLPPQDAPDRLVWGIKDNSIQKTLLQEKDLTFQRALAIAQGSLTEATDRNLREMKAPKQS